MEPPERRIKFQRPIIDSVCNTPVSVDGFRWAINNLDKEELSCFLRSYIRDRVPFAFITEPFLWESIRTWIANKLRIYTGNIGLNGSAQIGFSAAPDKFGVIFDKSKSDLDFFIVDEMLFDDLSNEVIKFCSNDKTASDNKYTNDNKETLQKTINKGFFDANKIPSLHDTYPKIANLNNMSSIVVDKLKLESFTLKNSHFRIYRNWHSYSNQMKINLSNIKDKI